MDLFYNRMQTLLADEYQDFRDALTKSPQKALYVNRLKDGAADIIPSSCIPHPLVEDGFYYDETIDHPGQSPYFLAGLYYIQEPSAMLVSSFLDVKEDDYVLDLCGAPGGKSCYVASRLGSQGLLITNDIVTRRAKILSENIERFASRQTIVTSADPRRFAPQLDGFFDKIILDAPCSGEGMFRTKEQAIETWSIEKVQECAVIQKQLIDTAYRLLKPQGRLIYSTCTYSIEENEDIIRYALQNYPFQLIPLPHSHQLAKGIMMDEAVRCYPHRFLGEGQFIALLEKQGGQPARKISWQKTGIAPDHRQALKHFYQDTLNIDMPKHLVDNNGHIYTIAPHFPKLKGIRILRNGLYLGEVRKGRLIPAHALALTLRPEDVKRSYSFEENSEEIRRYIHGETLPGKGQSGYGVIYVDQFPLAFYKESSQIKNLFPKGLRR